MGGIVIPPAAGLGYIFHVQIIRRGIGGRGIGGRRFFEQFVDRIERRLRLAVAVEQQWVVRSIPRMFADRLLFQLVAFNVARICCFSTSANDIG